MSVLGPLFVPRKDMPSVPKIKDNPELERWLSTLQQRVHTNELAIQRWANSAPRLAAVIGASSASATMNSNGTDFRQILPLDGTVNTYFAGIVDQTNNRIVFPQAGWYLVSATALWTTSAGQTTGDVEVFLYKNGDYVTPLTTSGPMAVAQLPATATYPSFDITPDYSTVNYAGIFAKDDYVELWGGNFIFVVDTLPPGVVDPNTTATAALMTCAIEFLGGTPSTVQ